MKIKDFIPKEKYEVTQNKVYELWETVKGRFPYLYKVSKDVKQQSVPMKIGDVVTVKQSFNIDTYASVIDGKPSGKKIPRTVVLFDNGVAIISSDADSDFVAFKKYAEPSTSTTPITTDSATTPTVTEPTPLSKEKEEKGLYIASSVGALAGLGFAHYRKSSVKGYIGYFILGSIVGSLFYNVVKPKSNAVTTDSSTDKDSSGASTSTSEKPMDGESAFNWLMSSMKKINPNAKLPSDEKKQIFLNAYNTLPDIEKNAFIDVSKMFECSTTSKDFAIVSDCMTQKGAFLEKKYSKDVLASMSKKMETALNGLVK